MLYGVYQFSFLFIFYTSRRPFKDDVRAEDNEMHLAIQKKYGFDQPLEYQYLYYLNDLSPLSFHSKNENDFTNVDNHRYTVWASIPFSKFNILLKSPYLKNHLFVKEHLLHLYS